MQFFSGAKGNNMHSPTPYKLFITIFVLSPRIINDRTYVICKMTLIIRMSIHRIMITYVPLKVSSSLRLQYYICHQPKLLWPLLLPHSTSPNGKQLHYAFYSTLKTILRNFHHALVITQQVCWSMKRDTKHPQFESQCCNILYTGFRRNKFARECASFDRVLPFAKPNYWSSI